MILLTLYLRGPGEGQALGESVYNPIAGQHIAAVCGRASRVDGLGIGIGELILYLPIHTSDYIGYSLFRRAHGSRSYQCRVPALLPPQEDVFEIH